VAPKREIRVLAERQI